MNSVSYCFVDAGSLRATLDEFSRIHLRGKQLRINYARVTSAVGAHKTFVYDAVPVRRDGEGEAEYEQRTADINAELEQAASCGNVHVYTGDAVYRKKRGHEQKKVDVLITVDMLSFAFRQKMNTAILITGDLDFKPLITALIREGISIALRYPQNHTTAELINSADMAWPIDFEFMRSIVDEPSQKLLLPAHSRIPLVDGLVDPDLGDLVVSYPMPGCGMIRIYANNEAFTALFDPLGNEINAYRSESYEVLKRFLMNSARYSEQLDLRIDAWKQGNGK